MKRYKKYVEVDDSSDESLKIGYRIGKLGLPDKTEYVYDETGGIKVVGYLKGGFVNILIPEEKKKQVIGSSSFEKELKQLINKLK